MNVVGYIRVSGTGQIEKEGPDRQRDAISAFCSRHGLNLTSDYFDAGVSGTIDGMDRPQFVQMVRAIIKRRALVEELEAQKRISAPLQIEAVVIEKVDRLARTLAVQEAAVLLLRKHGIKLYIASIGTLQDYAADSGDPSLNLFRQMLGAIAEFEKVNTCARLSQARASLRIKNGRCEGRKPYGFRPGESEILDFMRSLKKNGESYQEISSCLNEKGYKTRYGRPWSIDRIKNTLKPRTGPKRPKKLTVTPQTGNCSV